MACRSAHLPCVGDPADAEPASGGGTRIERVGPTRGRPAASRDGRSCPEARSISPRKAPDRSSRHGAASRPRASRPTYTTRGWTATPPPGSWERTSRAAAGSWARRSRTAKRTARSFRGAGTTSPRNRSDVESTLSGVYPYARLTLSERVSLWGLAGVGHGTLTVSEDGRTPVETDIGMNMGALGSAGHDALAFAGGRYRARAPVGRVLGADDVRRGPVRRRPETSGTSGPTRAGCGSSSKRSGSLRSVARAR